MIPYESKLVYDRPTGQNPFFGLPGSSLGRMGDYTTGAPAVYASCRD